MVMMVPILVYDFDRRVAYLYRLSRCFFCLPVKFEFELGIVCSPRIRVECIRIAR